MRLSCERSPDVLSGDSISHLGAPTRHARVGHIEYNNIRKESLEWAKSRLSFVSLQDMLRQDRKDQEALRQGTGRCTIQ